MGSIFQEVKLQFDKYTSSIGPDFEDLAWHVTLVLASVVAVFIGVSLLEGRLLQLQAACAADKACPRSVRCILKTAQYGVTCALWPVRLLLLLYYCVSLCAALMVSTVACFFSRAVEEQLWGVKRLAILAVILVMTPEGILDVLKSAVTAVRSLIQ